MQTKQRSRIRGIRLSSVQFRLKHKCDVASAQLGFHLFFSRIIIKYRENYKYVSLHTIQTHSTIEFELNITGKLCFEEKGNYYFAESFSYYSVPFVDIILMISDQNWNLFWEKGYGTE